MESINIFMTFLSYKNKCFGYFEGILTIFLDEESGMNKFGPENVIFGGKLSKFMMNFNRGFVSDLV